jgi:hypothetical protein
MNLELFGPYAWALGALALLWVVFGLVTRGGNPLRLVVGADGRPSTSKLQWFLWTVVVVFSYVAIYAARASRGYYEAVDYIPYNLLLAMGLSIGTMVAAKAITTSYVSSGQVNKPPVQPDAPAAGAPPAGAPPVAAGVTPTARATTGAGAVLKDDDGAPDLSKIQMMAWTLIAIGVYLYAVFHVVPEILGLKPPLPAADKVPGLPNIDAALMVLMGLGQGAYLGKKLVTTDTPRLFGLTPSSGPVGTTVTVSGASFGEGQGGNAVTIDGAPNIGRASEWHDSLIKFDIPATHPSSDPVVKGQKLDIGLIVNGQEGTNRLPFTVT